MDANARGRAAGLYGAPVRLCGHPGFRFEPASRMSKTRVLTGITTSGTPHLGNYVGAIRPAIAASRASGAESFYFLADYHSLIKGLDPDKVWFYRQSDIPEIPELTWLLTCVAGKGILNRAHAYKAAVDRNRAEGEDDDAGVTAGLFMYPVLMAADILLFNAHKVPVGRDQVQHIEMARDFGQRFNHVYGDDYFVLPEAAVDDNVATLPGLDGRKMSKSYNNTIPMFAPKGELKKLVAGILTDSRAPGEPKDTEGSALFQLYQAFATPEETAAFAQAFADGIGWGDAKQRLFERIDAEVAPLREKYEALMARPAEIEAILRDGAARLRAAHATPALLRLREAVGLRDLSRVPTVEAKSSKKVADAALPAFKQYRDADGKFYFKLVQGERVLLQSAGFASPRDACQRIAAIKQGEIGDAASDFRLGEGVTDEEVNAALAAFVAAQLEGEGGKA